MTGALPQTPAPDTPELQPLAAALLPMGTPDEFGPQILPNLQEAIPEPIRKSARPGAWSKGSPEARAHMAKARAARTPGAPRHAKPGTSRARHLAPDELREWLQRLNLDVDGFAFLIGRSRQAVYLWLAGDAPISSYVVRWIELLAAFDRFVRARMPDAEAQAAVYAWLAEQPGAERIAPERVAQRMGLPAGVVREAVARLRYEGLVK